MIREERIDEFGRGKSGFQYWRNYVFKGLLWGIIFFVLIVAVYCLKTLFGYENEEPITTTYLSLTHYASFNYFERVLHYVSIPSTYFALFHSILWGFYFAYCFQKGIPCLDQMKLFMKVFIFGLIDPILFLGFADLVLDFASRQLPTKEAFEQSLNHITNNWFYIISYCFVASFVIGTIFNGMFRTLTLITGFILFPILTMMSIHSKYKKTLREHLMVQHQNGWHLLMDCTIPPLFLWGLIVSINEGRNPLHLISGIVLVELLYNLTRLTIRNIRKNFETEAKDIGGDQG